PTLLNMVYPARYIGERVAIEHPKLQGARFLGIQFTYGPWNGLVGVRDCEGRLVAAQNLYMDKDVTFPQWTWIALPVANRDPWIYLEALGPAPAGLEPRFAIQKVMVVDEQY